MTPLSRAIALATEAHDGQVDKAGAPYILHPLRVMMAMATEEERIVAVLHDVLEDVPESAAVAVIPEFGERVASALAAITKRRAEFYGAYITRVAGNDLARRVKLADLRDNADLSRIAEPTDTDRARAEKYRRTIAQLEGV